MPCSVTAGRNHVGGRPHRRGHRLDYLRQAANSAAPSEAHPPFPTLVPIHLFANFSLPNDFCVTGSGPTSLPQRERIQNMPGATRGSHGYSEGRGLRGGNLSPPPVSVQVPACHLRMRPEPISSASVRHSNSDDGSRGSAMEISDRFQIGPRTSIGVMCDGVFGISTSDEGFLGQVWKLQTTTRLEPFAGVMTVEPHAFRRTDVPCGQTVSHPALDRADARAYR
jgi:hypothetical protein